MCVYNYVVIIVYKKNSLSFFVVCIQLYCTHTVWCFIFDDLNFFGLSY